MPWLCPGMFQALAMPLVPSLNVINTTINQLESKVSVKTIYFLRLFVVVYKHVML